MRNERKTESIFEDMLNTLGYYRGEIVVEYQKSQIAEVSTLLKTASKVGLGKGYPDFIITSKDYPDFLICVECKADVKKHKSKEKDKIKDYAVDGILHYSNFLKKSYHVVAIAFSGSSKEDNLIDIYLQPKGESKVDKLLNTSDEEVQELLEFTEFAKLAAHDRDVTKTRQSELLSFASDLHNFMRDYAKLTEQEKPLLVSGTLLALKNKPFASLFNEYSVDSLQKAWLQVIETEIKKADIPEAKKENMIQPYTSIAVHPELGQATEKHPKGVLYELISMLNKNVFPYIKYFDDYDVVGQFYGEFLKYTGGDKKGLGIVLTPKHITELFALLMDVNKKSIVIDPCVGTAGFLIQSMHHMLKNANTETERQNIKENNLIGIEQQPTMFALAASNMILRGDGKANLYMGNCFDEKIKAEIKDKQATIGMINPPYAQKGDGLHELDFIFNMLDMLVKGGKGIAIIPMSCVLQPHKLKQKLLKYHTLEAVMSMPEQLFNPVGVVSVIIIFTAHIPHTESDRETWFGYFKDDGHKLLQHRGRVNFNWDSIKEDWVSCYKNKKERVGFSVMQKVSHNEEWCVEAYMETDYSKLNENDFIKTLREYVAFKVINDGCNEDN